MNLTKVILILGAIQGIFLMIALFRKNFENRRGNAFLGILLFAITSYFFYGLAESSNFPKGLYLVLKINSIAIGLLIGPSFYLYINSLFSVKKLNIKALYYHFLPYALLVIVLVIIEVASGRIGSIPPNGSQLFIYLIEGFKLTHLVTYLTLSVPILYKQNTLENIEYYGNSRQILRWLKILLLLFILTVIGSFAFFVWVKFIYDQAIVETPIYLIIPLTLIVYSIAFIAIRYPLFIFRENQVLVFKEPAKYQTSSLKANDKHKILEILGKEMETNRPYLDHDLTIEMVAERTKIPSHHLSQTINEMCNKSFNTFINDYRVEAFKRKVSDKKHANKTILAMAFDSGFASKSSFNRIFKAHTGLTPYAYKKMS